MLRNIGLIIIVHYACLLCMSCAMFVTNVYPSIVLDNVIRAWTLSSRV